MAIAHPVCCRWWRVYKRTTMRDIYISVGRDAMVYNGIKHIKTTTSLRLKTSSALVFTHAGVSI